MERLLVVDDDAFIRILAQDVLEDAGYSVEFAEDGEVAWQKITSNPSRFDLILLDRSMPNLDGIEVLKRIKSDLRFRDLPVIMLTGATDQQNVQEGLAAGAHYYLTKPTPADLLKTVIRNALAELRNKRELLALLGHQTASMQILQRAAFSFSSLQEAKNLALTLAELSMAPERTVNAYSELLINAVEHGNLGISYAEKSQLVKDGRWAEEIAARLQRQPYSALRVRVNLKKTETVCMVTIKDEGNGFKWSEYLDFSPDRAFDLHGRGIAMSMLLGFDSIEYIGNGNTVVTTVKLPL